MNGKEFQLLNPISSGGLAVDCMFSRYSDVTLVRAVVHQYFVGNQAFIRKVWTRFRLPWPIRVPRSCRTLGLEMWFVSCFVVCAHEYFDSHAEARVATIFETIRSDRQTRCWCSAFGEGRAPALLLYLPINIFSCPIQLHVNFNDKVAKIAVTFSHKTHSYVVQLQPPVGMVLALSWALGGELCVA